MYSEIKKNNFDFIRLLLAATVFIANAEALSRTDALLIISRYINAGMAVDAFFVISGFLVFMSYENSSSLRGYFAKRARRIFPAYAAVVVICSCLLFSVSSNNFLEYFFTLEWLEYLFFNLLFLNFMQHSLPGVFENNYLHAVNGALWTIQIEVTFYFSVPIIKIFIVKINKIFIISIFYLSSVSYAMCMAYLGGYYEDDLLVKIGKLLPGQLSFFISGAFIYYYYGHFKKYSALYIMFGVSGFILARGFELYPMYPISLAILVIYFSTIFKCLGNWGKHGDLSYGVYIWHFPIVQAFVHLQLFDSSPYIGLVSAALTVFFVAYLSWHFVEKPYLKRDSHYRIVENRLIREGLNVVKNRFS